MNNTEQTDRSRRHRTGVLLALVFVAALIMGPGPGILLVNRKLTGSGYELTDVTATLLAHYGVDPLPVMIGEPIR